jgi:hypothetical protein
VPVIKDQLNVSVIYLIKICLLVYSEKFRKKFPVSEKMKQKCFRLIKMSAVKYVQNIISLTTCQTSRVLSIREVYYQHINHNWHRLKSVFSVLAAEVATLHVNIVTEEDRKHTGKTG